MYPLEVASGPMQGDLSTRFAIKLGLGATKAAESVICAGSIIPSIVGNVFVKPIKLGSQK